MEQAIVQSRFSVDDYLKLEQESDQKHEFRNGEIIAMAGGSLNHSLIIANVIGEVRNRLKGKPCRVFDSNLRIRIARKLRYSYPDVSVICDEAQFDPQDSSRTTVTNPRLIVEVLSSSTEMFDRGEKFRRYLQIDSLEEYALVSQDEPRVECYFRQTGGTWLFSPQSGREAIITFRSLGIQIPTVEIYAGVDFPANEPDD